MTPRALATVLEGAAWRVEHEARLATTMAWMTEAFRRQKRLPSLKKVLAGRGTQKPQPQTVEQQAAIIRALHAQLGGTLTAGKAGT